MKKILYIGNKLEGKGKTASSIDVLGTLLENEGYTVYYASSKNNKIFRLLDMLFACFRYRKKADLVLIDTYSTQNFYYALLVSQSCRFFKLPYVPILHGGNLENRLENNLKSCKKIFNHAQICVAPSLFLKDVFKKYGFKEIVHIPNPISIEEYQFIKRDKLKPKLLWVRAFSKIYNPIMALQVVKLLNDMGIEGSLSMVGPDKDGSMGKAKNEAEKLGIKVEFTGKLHKAEWIAYAKDFDIFINTTNFDNTPVSVVEGMALGLPVISTNAGGIPYLIEHRKEALLVEKGDAEAMANGIKELLEAPELVEKLTQNAKEKVKSFDWKVVKVKWKEIIDAP
ncbi:glycosyltransferase [Flavobacteriaceae bacterium R38]|nr:glycosyltransferase [Flavobacteriaceae bacterium R38]